MGLEATLAYVDNFFTFSLPGQAAATHAKLELVFAEAGIELHEQYIGQSFPGLGWEWRIADMLMICPEDKYVAFTRYLGLWQAAKFLSLDECETAVGLLSWGSAGLPTLKACIAPLIHMRTSVKRLTKASSSGKVWQQAISPNARSALDFARVVFTEWDRSCAIVQGFGPTAMWDSLGRCDASGTG
jgi:hypothetical protein